MAARKRGAPVSLLCGNIISGLVARRHALGWSQRDLGNILGTARQNIGAWERGEDAPTLGSLLRWARALDMHVRIIVGEGLKPRRGKAA